MPSRWPLLDNRTPMLVESRRGPPGRVSITLDHYYPLYELNQNRSPRIRVAITQRKRKSGFYVFHVRFWHLADIATITTALSVCHDRARNISAVMLHFPLCWAYFAMRDRCPLYPQKRTCAVQLGMSALCQ